MDRLEPSVEPTPATDEQDAATQSVFRDIERSGALPADVPALEAAYTVLCALEMRLPRRPAEQVAHDIPPTLRMLISRCVSHETARPEISFDEPAFLRLVASALHISVADAERVTRAVFVAVQKLLPEGEILALRRRLPSGLDDLWHPVGPASAEAFEPASREGGDVFPGGRPAEEPIETMLRDIEHSGVLPDKLSAPEALQAALCTLSLELTAHEAQEIADTSRTLHRLLGPCVQHRAERPQVMYRPTFLHQLAEHLGVDERRAEQIARTVFAAVRGRLPPDEIHKIDGRMPRNVRDVWKPR